MLYVKHYRTTQIARLAIAFVTAGVLAWPSSLPQRALTSASAMAPRQTPETQQQSAVVKPNDPVPGCVPAPSGLVSWWPFDGNFNDFQLTNPVVELCCNQAFVPGEVAQALNFDGVFDLERVAGSSSLNVGAGDGFTIDLWINPSDLSVPRPLVEWGNFFGLFGVHLWQSVTFGGAQGPGNLYASIIDTNGANHIISSAPRTLDGLPNTYQHVALVYEKTFSVAILYVDGNIVATEAFGAAFTPQTTYDLYFGHSRSRGTRFVGQMDEIEIFNRVLSQSEIQAIVNAGSAGKCKTRYVTNTNNSGAGSLHQTITDSNTYPGPDTINFNILGGGVKTIRPQSALPTITGPLTIDGTTQPGFAGTPLIELNGAMAGSATGLLCAALVTIKGLVINRFSGVGIELLTGSSGSTIAGNYIGTDVTGTLDLGNGQDGILIGASNNNTIGGTSPGARNVISGNNDDGIFFGVNSGNVVQGNLIGTDVTGTQQIGNSRDGIFITNNSNQIGGTTPAARNVISGNFQRGVVISGSNATQNLVQGNYIGTNATGTAALGNGMQGVLLNPASNNTVGLDSAGAGTGNTIAFNGDVGVLVDGGTSVRNAIRGNLIFSNGSLFFPALGIDLSPTLGITPNDPLDGDTGANNLQNFPVLTSAISSGGSTTIQGTLNSTPGQSFRVEFFANSNCDSLGNGEGQTFLGFTNVNTNASGNATPPINVVLPVSVPVGQFITSTATDANGNTSEFSACITAAPTAVTLISFNATAYDDGVFIEWQTGFEVDNLGFNIYRQDAGKLAVVNQQLIAGSALRVGSGVKIESGESYAWWDKGIADCGSRIADCHEQYWLEDVDLSGRSTWHGPFAAVPSSRNEHPRRFEQARMLASLAPSKGDSFAYEPRATLPQAASSVAPLLFPAPQSTALKIVVKDAGWYKLTQSELVAAGFDAAADPRRLQMFADGRQQPILVNGEGDGTLDADDSIEFYGIGIDSPYSNTRTYWLVAGKDPGQRIQTVQSPAKPDPSGGFSCTTERRDRTIYFAALLNGERENFFGAVLATQPLDQTLASRHIDFGSSANATLEVAMQGVTRYPHRVIVQFNGANAGYMSYEGQANSTASFSVPPSLLREGENNVSLTTTGAPSDVSLVDYIRLTYQRSYAADGDRLRLTAAGGRPLTISGFSSEAIRVFDVTDPGTVREVKGEIDKSEAGYNVSLYTPGSGERTLLALTAQRAQRPAKLTLDRPTSWRSENNRADLLIITASQFFNQAAKLKALRESQGMSVAIVDVEDIYDEFSYGQKAPGAVRQFLEVASKNWKRPIRYAVFFGDASYDPKNYLELGDGDLVPTKLIDTLFMETASDDWLADFNNDGIADIAIGRLPARTEREAELLINKLLTYEKSAGSREALLIADRNDGYDFEGAIDGLRLLIPVDVRVTSVKRGQMGDTAAKAALIEALNRGQKLVSYSGHGSANVWRGNLLTNADASRLQNGERLSVFVMMNCLNGYFHDPASDSLSEALLKGDKGGAIAVWASSAMTFPEGQIEMTKEFYRQVFGGRPVRLGDAARRAKTITFDPDVRRTWILFGDPTARTKNQ